MNKGKLRRILTIIIIIGFCFGIITLSVNTLRFHTVYRQGMNIVKNDPAVLEFFGPPIKGGLFVLGTTQKFYDGGGSVSLRTSLSGSEARGKISILGTQASKDGLWGIVITIQVQGEDVFRYSSSYSEQGFQLLKTHPNLNAPLASPTPP